MQKFALIEQKKNRTGFPSQNSTGHSTSPATGHGAGNIAAIDLPI